MTAATHTRLPAEVRTFVRFLETGEAEGLFARAVFGDITFPRWRVQVTGAEELVAFRLGEHPGPGTVRVERYDLTPRGWVVQLEERWEDGGQQWYAREVFRADVEDGRVVELAAYCTGDWDEARQREHAEKVTLTRP